MAAEAAGLFTSLPQFTILGTQKQWTPAPHHPAVHLLRAQHQGSDKNQPHLSCSEVSVRLSIVPGGSAQQHSGDRGSSPTSKTHEAPGAEDTASGSNDEGP